MPWNHDPSDYDGPPAWWTARRSRAEARRPACDEYGTPLDEDDDSDDDTDDDSADDDSADDDSAPEGDSGDGGAP